MTKKETELQNKILTVLEGNTKALENLYDLLIKISQPPVLVIPEAEPVKPAKPTNSDKSKVTMSDGMEITAEYCRKALKAVRTKLSDKETRVFLAQFGDAKTIPDLDVMYYDAFIQQATLIMKGK